MKSKRNMSIHDMAVRLCEGGTAWIDGHCLVAVECEPDVRGCDVCKLDSACSMKIAVLCGECEVLTDKHYHLDFAYNRIKQ